MEYKKIQSITVTIELLLHFGKCAKNIFCISIITTNKFFSAVNRRILLMKYFARNIVDLYWTHLVHIQIHNVHIPTTYYCLAATCTERSSEKKLKNYF